MALKEYAVEVNGRQTTLQLSDEDAKMHGLKASDAVKKAAADDEKKAPAPANKAAKQPSNKQAEAAEQALGH